MYDFPRYYENFWGKTVGRMLNKEFGSEINSYLRTPFYLLDQAAACKTMKPEMANGKNIICNRYLTSSMIFQTALIRDSVKRKNYLAWLEQASYKELDMILPDIVFGLYVDAKVAHEMNAKKTKREYTNGKVHDMNEENIKLQVNVGKEIKRLCKERANWHLINCMDGVNIKTPEQIHLAIIEKYNSLRKK
jgi:dTMP kinase